MLEVPRLSSWPSFLVCLPFVSPSLKASNAIHMSVDSQFISPAWTAEMLVFHSREVYPTAYMTFPLGCCINQERLGYALLTMTSSLSGVSQKSFSLMLHIPHDLHCVIFTPGFRLMEQLPSGTLLITVYGRIENTANHKLVLETSDHISLAKSSPIVNLDLSEVGKCSKHLWQLHSLSDMPNRHLQPL